MAPTSLFGIFLAFERSRRKKARSCSGPDTGMFVCLPVVTHGMFHGMFVYWSGLRRVQGGLTHIVSHDAVASYLGYGICTGLSGLMPNFGCGPVPV